jgi:DNA repair exonuclease SbcCD ATPase subunit
MLNIKKLRYKNFLSSSSVFTELDFQNYRTTLIVGANGAGKTTFIDALCYVLFGKPLRNVNKPQLINSITLKGLLVECDFSIQGHDYMVRRGMKPNVFEIYKDGELVKQLSEMGDYQAYFEKYILKMGYKTFIQIVIQGSDDYVPFMRLPAQARRDVIEDLLETEIYSVMLELLKKNVQSLKDDTLNNDNAIRICESKIEMNKQHLKSLKQNNEELILQKLDKIKEYVAEQESCSAALLHLIPLAESLQDSTSKLDESLKRQRKIQESMNAAESKCASLERDKLFYENNDSCPTCHHDLDENFKVKHIQEIEAKIAAVMSAAADLEPMKRKVESEIETGKAAKKELEKVEGEVRKNKLQLLNYERLIDDANADIKLLKEKTKEAVTNDDITTQLDEEFVKLQIKKKELANRAELYGWGHVILKDGGVKTSIIKQYVPIMNKIINEYLDKMDFMVSFHLDENFKEVIKSRYRDEFTYGLFSSGQKQRIDLAMLFTWRAIARMRNNAACNLLVMDEILDSHLDDEGNDQILDIIKGIASDNNIVVISHHKDKMVDKFDRTINFELKNNFSRMY